MDLYPSHIAEPLGFEAVRAAIEARTASEPGRAAVRDMRPSAFDAACDELAVVSAIQAAFDGEAVVPEALFDAVEDFVAAVRPAGAYLDPDALLEVRRLCATSMAVERFMAGGPEVLVARGGQFQPVSEVVRAIDGLLESDGEIRDGASQGLRRVRRSLRSAQSHVRKSLLAALRRASGEGWATEDQPTMRSGRMVIPVRSEAKRKMGGIVHDLSASGQTAFVEPAETVELNNDVRELEAEERREVVRLLTEVSGVVREAGEKLLNNQAILADFDVWRAKAEVAALLGSRSPDRFDAGAITLREARNPELLLLERERTVVPLDLELGTTNTMLVISGPNAGGKSVAMKTVGLLAYMLGCGIPIPVGEGSRFDRFDRLMGDIGDEQSVEDDLSTFSSRLDRTRHMLSRADERTLVLVDEAGTGTDPSEGAALAQAVLESLLESGARVVVTTHHAALKQFAHQAPRAVNGMMRFDQERLRPTYVFDAGVPGASYAFEIADRMGLPENVVSRGRELVGSEQVSMERLLSDLQARNADLESRIVEQQEEAARASRQRQLLEARLEALSEARDEIRGRALEEADRILGAANAEVERAIREIRESEAEKTAVRDARARLEERKESVGRAKKKTRRKHAARKKPVETGGPVGVGDRVRVGSDGPAGDVISIKGDEVVVAIGPAHTRVRKGRLIKVAGPRAQQVAVTAPRVSGGARLRIDVRGRRAHEVVPEVERFVDEAVSAGLSRAEILHGKGTGALRASIHDYLDSRPDIASYAEAPIEQGGAGVTIVEL